MGCFIFLFHLSKQKALLTLQTTCLLRHFISLFFYGIDRPHQKNVISLHLTFSMLCACLFKREYSLIPSLSAFPRVFIHSFVHDIHLPVAALCGPLLRPFAALSALLGGSILALSLPRCLIPSSTPSLPPINIKVPIIRCVHLSFSVSQWINL